MHHHIMKPITIKIRTPRLAMRLAGIAAVALITGCAAPAGTPANPDDPWEGSNRAIYQFNDEFDKGILRPVSELYAFVMPQPVRTCIHNMFMNLGEIWSAINSSLQGRHEDAINTWGRFMLNTTLGVGGCIDVASANGAKRIPNDFGVTLGVWGVSPGPYVVLPFIGASSVRDTVGTAANFTFNQIDIVGSINDVGWRNSIYGVEVVSRREALLDVSKTVDRTALDPYSFIRDAYLQRRKAQVLGEKALVQTLPNYDDDETVEEAEKTLDMKQPTKGQPNQPSKETK